jgi:small-conductance mechanosensitive channel
MQVSTEEPVRGVTVATYSGGLAMLVGVVVVAIGLVFVVRRLLVRRTRWAWAGNLAMRCTRPGYLVTGTVAASVGLSELPALGTDLRLGEQLFGSFENVIEHALLLVLIASIAWLFVQVLQVFAEALLTQFESQHGAYSTRVKRARTQVMLAQRIVVALTILIAISAMLFTWERVRVLGAGLLASAGVAGLIIGLAAQRAIGNVLAGLQLAFSDMLHVDDVVVVEGEWGEVEELTLSYVVVRIWDGRRLMLPVSYFTETPFENWTKTDRSIIGTVFLRLDWSVPVAELRARLHEILREHPLWDGKDWGLVVTDVEQSGIVKVRATMSAADGSDSWTLNCDVREGLVTFVRERYPESLPRMRAEIHQPEMRRPGTETGS